MPKLIPSLWADKMMGMLQAGTKPLVQPAGNFKYPPKLSEDIRALLAVANAEYQWSEFSLSWMVRFNDCNGRFCAVLVDESVHVTLEQWADLCVKVKEKMEAEHG